jgi:hypothetical protein
MKKRIELIQLIIPMMILLLLGCTKESKKEEKPEIDYAISPYEMIASAKIADKAKTSHYADTSGYAKNFIIPVSSGSYKPIWKSTQGFTQDPKTCDCEYNRVGSLVTVVCRFEVPRFGTGTNRATISVPPNLPVSSPPLVSGIFSSDFYRNILDPNIGIVNRRSTSNVELQINNNPKGLASAWCSFSYKTSAN